MANVGMLGAGAAGAETMQTSFTGAVTSNNPFLGVPAIGSTFSGGFTIDSSVLTGDGPNCVATPNCWSGDTTSWSLNGSTFTRSTFLLVIPQLYAVRIAVADSGAGLGPDIYTVSLSGYSLTTVELTLTDSTGSAFESAANPLFPSFNTFDSSNFRYIPLCVTGISCASNPRYAGVVTSLVTAPVPEPDAAAMMLVGLLALGAFAKRQVAKT